MIDQSLLDDASKWLSDGINHYLAPSYQTGLNNDPRRLKALCEIAFLEYDVTVLPSFIIRERIAPILKDNIFTSSFLSLFYHNIVHANLFLPLALSTIRAHSVSAQFLEDIKTLTQIALNHTKERLPFRMLDLFHCAYRFSGKQEYMDKIVEIGKFGCLGGLSSVTDFNTADDYAITHTIFYLTDFGRQPWPETVCGIHSVLEVIDLLTEIAERDNNYDLLGEYLLCRQMLGQWDEITKELASLLINQVVNRQYWPGPVDLKDALRKDGIEYAEMDFYQHYHTTIVVLEALKRMKVGRIRNYPSPLNILSKQQDVSTNTENRIEFENNNLESLFLHEYQSLDNGKQIMFFDNNIHLLNDPKHILECVEFCHWASRIHSIPESWKNIFIKLTNQYYSELHQNSRFIRILVLIDTIVNGLEEFAEEKLMEDVQRSKMDYKQNPSKFLPQFVDRLIALAVRLTHSKTSRLNTKYAETFIQRALWMFFLKKAWLEFAQLLAHAMDLFNKDQQKMFVGLAVQLQPKSLSIGWLTPQNQEEMCMVEDLSIAIRQVKLAVKYPVSDIVFFGTTPRKGAFQNHEVLCTWVSSPKEPPLRVTHPSTKA